MVCRPISWSLFCRLAFTFTFPFTFSLTESSFTSLREILVSVPCTRSFLARSEYVLRICWRARSWTLLYIYSGASALSRSDREIQSFFFIHRIKWLPRKHACKISCEPANLRSLKRQYQRAQKVFWRQANTTVEEPWLCLRAHIVPFLASSNGSSSLFLS